jgi:RhoGEF domain
MYSYTQERPIEGDFHDYNGEEFSTSPANIRPDPFSRSPKLRNASLRVETEDLQPPPLPPTPPPHLEINSPTPRGHSHSSSLSKTQTPPIHRSRTEPRQYRPLSTGYPNDAPAPPTPPKIPLPVSVSRSQSHSIGVKPVPRPPMRPAKEALLQLDESPLTPVTESNAFPLSSKTFQRCSEPWSLSALRTWIQDVFGPNVSMETVTLALQGLFTHHVSTLSNQMAEKLASQVGTTWLREGVLFEPTIANTALWNPLSTLEFSLTPVQIEGVLPTLTGKGCYSTRCAITPPGVGRCYSHLCSRTLIKKSALPTEPNLPTPTGPTSDWVSFWNIDTEFTRSMEKREIKRQNVIFEFIQAEEEYVSDLTTMLNAQKQLITASNTQTPIIPSNRLDSFLRTVFGNVKPILDWQSKKLLIPLRERQAQQGPVVRGVGDVVLEWVRGCSSIYADYAGGYPSADLLVREETTTNPFFAQWLEVFYFFEVGLMV